MQLTSFFNQGALSEQLRRIPEELREQLESMSAEQVLESPEEDLVQSLLGQARVEPLALDLDGKRLESFDERPASGGATAVVRIPIRGKRALLRYQPATSLLGARYEGYVDGGDLVLTLPIEPLPDEARVTPAIDAAIGRATTNWLRQFDYIRPEVGQFNAAVEPKIREIVSRRRNVALRFLAARGAIDIPLLSQDPPPTIAVALQEKRVRLPAPKASAAYADEPRLEPAAYEQVLDRLRLMGQVLERSPAAFETLGEEHLRFHFLVVLNSLFGLEGTASGETFNAAGKTDILIRWQNANLFVAECKVWVGAKVVTKAVTQLLSYLTWRDSHAALLLFVHVPNFSRVMQRAVEAVEDHPNHKRSQPAPTNEGRFKLHLPGDRSREVSIALLGFWMPPSTRTSRPRRT